MEGLGLNGGFYLNAFDFLLQGFLLESVPKTICFSNVRSGDPRETYARHFHAAKPIAFIPVEVAPEARLPTH